MIIKQHRNLTFTSDVPQEKICNLGPWVRQILSIIPIPFWIAVSPACKNNFGNSSKGGFLENHLCPPCGRVRTLPGALHIPALARNLISVSKLDDVGVKMVFEKDTCKMVRGALILMRGVRIGTLYKLQGSTVVDGCNSSMVPENGVENLVVSGEKTMLWHQRLGHMERRAFEYFMVKVW